MDIQALKAFASAPAISGSYMLGANIPVLYGTNAALILGIFHEMQDIRERGDSQLGKIPLKSNDAMSGYFAFLYLHGLILNKPSKEFGPETLPAFLKAAQKLCDVYYTPKIAATKECLETASQEWQRLEARYNYLAKAAMKDPRAAGLLHDEFYADGMWDPELADDYDALPQAQAGTINLVREKSLRRLKDIFARGLNDDFTRNREFPVRVMLGTPENMQKQSGLEKVSIQSRDRNTKALQAVTDLIAGLQAIVAPPVARVYSFPAGNALAKAPASVLS